MLPNGVEQKEKASILQELLRSVSFLFPAVKRMWLRDIELRAMIVNEQSRIYSLSVEGNQRFRRLVDPQAQKVTDPHSFSSNEGTLEMTDLRS